MEQQVLDLLAATLDPSGPIRIDAERRLEQLYTNDAFPMSLISIASHKSIELQHRQAALLYFRKVVLKTWSPSIDDFEGPNVMSDAIKEQVRQSIFSIATAGDEEKKVTAVASYLVSKIASVDFPDQWPTLLPTLLNLVPHANDTQLHGVLVVLGDLVDDGLDEERFAACAAELMRGLYDVATNDQKKLMSRALAVSMFRSSINTMESIYQTNPAAVELFMQSASEAWVPFFIETVKSPLPAMPSELDEPGSPGIRGWRGVVALKTQAVKALEKIHTVFPQLLLAHTMVLFSTVWEALHTHLEPYHILYTHEEQPEGKLKDDDKLPYSLDQLVIEEVDYIQTLLSTSAVKHELDAQLASENVANGGQNASWITQVLAIAVGFSYVVAEDENMWEFDVNTFLAEETADSAVYSARNACAEVVGKLCSHEWPVLENLLTFSKSLFDDPPSTPKAKEAALFIVKQGVEEVGWYDKIVNPDVLRGYLDLVRVALQDENDLLRARGYIVAGILITAPGNALVEHAPDFARQSIKAVADDESIIVKVSCIKALQRYLKAISPGQIQDFQVQTVAAISGFLSSQDIDDLGDGEEDLLITLVETLRDAIFTDPGFCLEHPVLDVLFTVARYGAKHWHATEIVNEAFVPIVSTMAAKGPEAYARLCSKVLPSLTGALDVGGMTQENSLSDVAVTLLCSLAEYGSEPLPQGFVATLVPKLYRLLTLELDWSVHQSATVTLRHIVAHDSAQLLEWHDPETGKGGLEITLLIIDRLLGPNVDDLSAAEVGGLAVELVEKAGPDRLGPYLLQLLQVVAFRLNTAERANFIQSLVLVFARLALTNAKEVLDFLAQVHIEGAAGGTGLEVVMKKWLDNSVNFAGYEAIRQNVAALTNIYKLHDERLANIQTKGDLVVENDSRIKTRSQAKLEPDQYSIIPVSLKLIKVLVQELVSASSAGLPPIRKHSVAHTAGSDDDEWEDEPPNVLDLASPSTRQDLMGLMDEADRWNIHQADDETQRYLIHFFNEISSEPSFHELFQALTAEEQRKLHETNNDAPKSVFTQ